MKTKYQRPVERQGGNMKNFLLILFVVVISHPLFSQAGSLGLEPIPIVRSFGEGSSMPLASGSIATISFDGAFNITPGIPDKVGVGDVVIAQTADDQQHAFVIYKRRVSGSATSTLDVRHIDGSPVQVALDIESWQIFRAHTSLYDLFHGTWNSGLDIMNIPQLQTPFSKNLVQNNLSWTVYCYADAPVTGNGYIWGYDWVTDAAHPFILATPYLPEQVGVSQRHAGIWDSGRFHIKGRLDIQSVDVRLEGIQFTAESVWDDYQYLRFRNEMAPHRVEVARCLFVGQATDKNNVFGIAAQKAVNNPIDAELVVINSIFYDFYPTTVNASGAIVNSDTMTLYAINNIFVHCGEAVRADGGNIRAVNNIFQFCATDISNAVYMDFTYSRGNVTSRSTFPGTHNSTNLNVLFVDGSAKNFHLHASDVAALDQGAIVNPDLSSEVNYDVDNQWRQSPWDIGADDAGGIIPPTPTATLDPNAPTMTPTPGKSSKNSDQVKIRGNVMRGKEAASTEIDFVLDEEGWVRIAVFNQRGRLIRKIAEKSFGAGQHTLAWDGRDEKGNKAGSGIYQVLIETRNGKTRKQIVIAR
jgi:prepilin-type processing-associated H-X9-DG protein